MPRAARKAAGRRRGRAQRELQEWSRRDFAMPAPPRVKRAVLRRLGNPSDVWIETGTYRGDTTAFLARTARHVYSIEPGADLASRAKERFAGDDRVTIVEGLSEEQLAHVLEQVDGSVSFWLDGHFSAGVTHRGPVDTPIREELAVIEKHLPRLPAVRVLVDDVRCFDPSDPSSATYPARRWLMDWAERNGMTWTIEHDIFAAWR